MPSMNMTVKAIEAIKPDSKRVDYFDTLIPGLALRVNPRGRKTWLFMYRSPTSFRMDAAGRKKPMQRRLELKVTTLADARDRAREAQISIRKGEDPQEARQQEKKAVTFEQLSNLYIEQYAKTFKKSWRKDETIIKRDLLPKLGRKTATAVKRAEVIEILDAIKDRGAGILANRTLEIIRRIYSWAIEEGKLETTPCVKIKKRAPEKKRRRVLSDDEIRAFWTATEKETWQMQCIFRLRLVLAQRGVEISSLRKADIEGRWWTVPAEISKNGLEHRVYLNDLALDIIEHAKEKGGKSPWVFPSPRVNRKGEDGPITNLGKRAVVIRDRAKADWRAHDLRRTASTRMTGELKIPRSLVGKVLNHTDRDAPKATAHYDVYQYDDEKKDALSRWGAHLAVILAGKAANAIPLKQMA